MGILCHGITNEGKETTMTNKRPLDYAVDACDTIMRKFAPADLPPRGKFHYHQGVFLSGMMKVAHMVNDDRYFQYMKGWVDSLVDADGVVHGSTYDEMDDIQPGILLYELYERTHDERYKKALDFLVDLMLNFVRNPEGGFWHKGMWPNQMWLDGIYMGGPITTMYAKRFNKPVFFEISAFQALLMGKKCRDAKTGLMYHAYDQSRKAEWADPVTGQSAEFWGRAMGWVVLALMDELDDMPKEFALREEMIQMLTDLLKALIPYQDEKTGLWYQVVNRGDDPRNWFELSCSCLFTCGIAKSVRLGYLAPCYLQYARKGYQGVIDTLRYDENGLILSDICTGTNVGDYEHYLNRPRSQNDLHGMGAFTHMCCEMEQIL